MIAMGHMSNETASEVIWMTMTGMHIHPIETQDQEILDQVTIETF